MPKGIPVAFDVEATIELVLRERKIALPTSRLLWYCRWLKVNCSRKEVSHVCMRMVREGTLIEIKEGREKYYKLAR